MGERRRRGMERGMVGERAREEEAGVMEEEMEGREGKSKEQC